MTVWVLAGLGFGRRTAEVHEQTTEVNDRYLANQRSVAEARNEILTSSIHIRQVLLLPSSDPGNVASRARVTESLEAAEARLAEYVPLLGSADEQRRVSRLRDEVRLLKAEMLKVLDDTETDNVGLQLNRLMPHREAVMNMANELGALNRATFVEYQVEAQAIYRDMQLQIWRLYGIAVGASLIIAGFSVVYLGRLERRLRAQQARDAELQADLHRLSSTLLVVREDERRAVARELHDEIGQLLTAAKVELAIARRPIEKHGAPPDLLTEARSIVDQALHATRNLSYLLHPPVLDGLGLVAAIDWHIGAFSRRCDTEVSFTHDGLDSRPSQDVEMAAYRIVQEGLTNVGKHAQAKSCLVNLRTDGGNLIVTLEDDGLGFDPTRKESPGGLGLVSMRERAMRLGGALTVDSAVGQAPDSRSGCPSAR
jgi:signal transduction histidine kinase